MPLLRDVVVDPLLQPMPRHRVQPQCPPRHRPRQRRRACTFWTVGNCISFPAFQGGMPTIKPIVYQGPRQALQHDAWSVRCWGGLSALRGLSSAAAAGVHFLDDWGLHEIPSFRRGNGDDQANCVPRSPSGASARCVVCTLRGRLQHAAWSVRCKAALARCVVFTLLLRLQHASCSVRCTPETGSAEPLRLAS